MYYELFNDVFVDNENKICIFEIGAFYVVLNEQAIYLSELLGLKKVCFAPGICKVGFPVGSLSKSVKKLTDLSISFVVLSTCNMDSSADYIYGVKGFKKKCEIENKTIIFENDGEKIKEDMLDRIFLPYVKGNKGQSGLGLSIVKKTVNVFRYDIAAENTNEGVRFVIK